MDRRKFVKNIAVAGSSALLFQQKVAAAATEQSSTENPVPEQKGDNPTPRELTVAGLQMHVTSHWERNEQAIHRAIDQAAKVKADFLLTPEGSVSGYHAEFDRAVVANAVARLAQHAKELQVGLLLGTCYKEEEEVRRRWDPNDVSKRQELCYDQVRVYAPNGEYLGAHSKILLGSSILQPGTGEMQTYVGGTLRAFSWKGIRFGVLICNDLWATPGSTSISNPYLAWHLKQMGAEVLFHAVNSGSVPRYRPFHESTQALWAWALNIPVVTTNAAPIDDAPVNCRAGVIGADGERSYTAHDAGEQFFSYKLSLS